MNCSGFKMLNLLHIRNTVGLLQILETCCKHAANKLTTEQKGPICPYMDEKAATHSTSTLRYTGSNIKQAGMAQVSLCEPVCRHSAL